MEKKLIYSREDLSPEEFYDKYYISTGLERDLVIELLIHVSKEIGVPVEKLRPEDRFLVELHPGKFNEWDSGYGILIFELNNMAKKQEKKIEKKIETIDDYLREMSKVYFIR